MTTNTIDPKVLAAAEKLMAKKAKEMEKRIEDIKTKHAHALIETLSFDESVKKFAIDIKCIKCGTVRRVFTSDLHEVQLCVECTKEKNAAKKAAKKAELKAALELLKNR